MAYDERLAERVRLALAPRRDVVEKKMFGGVCFMVAGHMCCGIVKNRLMIRLGSEQASSLLGTPHVLPMDFTGKPLRGFLYVEPKGIASSATLRTWVSRAVQFAESAPPKKRRSVK
jgi:TfoX/Sxy family transcriptional regulator of competence genes